MPRVAYSSDSWDTRDIMAFVPVPTRQRGSSTTCPDRADCLKCFLVKMRLL